ncbi:hypothetical protein NEOLI_004965 [Neolecta irregularis DAH-3]|uniref:Uncharacterized protein n=1 Tax=Neolecta irregularis (strain DAH-3) TaxID=1198029 RepID=A0A1U7LIA1_NEOID|nr:hypothetical protein NEOLI_004965 [Neolecta irregularis DAH-3]|eukprot:OLL22323.1 hypothetical protein NEOLI_004965 [Neolecta irregularis DAH-3]
MIDDVRAWKISRAAHTSFAAGQAAQMSPVAPSTSKVAGSFISVIRRQHLAEISSLEKPGNFSNSKSNSVSYIALVTQGSSQSD